jgi:hypothetical protein
MTNATFQIGNTYSGRFIGDYDSVFQITILKRSAKFVTIENPYQPGETKRCAIQEELDGGEFIKPFGTYSMAPYCKASRLVTP